MPAQDERSAANVWRHPGAVSGRSLARMGTDVRLGLRAFHGSLIWNFARRVTVRSYPAKGRPTHTRQAVGSSVFLLNETLSIGCWFLIGRWADASHVRLGRILMVYAAARLAIAVTGSYNVGWRVQVLFWLCLGLWSVGVLSIRAGLRLTRPEAQRHRSHNSVL